MTASATTTARAPKSLEDLIQAAGNPVDLLRRNPAGAFTFPVVPQEFTNWLDEQRAARETASLCDLSYHMTELRLRGRDVVTFVKQFSMNKLDPFQTNRAKQLVAVAPDGNMIGDAIMFRESEDFLRVVGAPSALDWLHFQSELTALDVTAQVELSSAARPGPRDVFRVQIQGPNAFELMREVCGGTLPDIKFFQIGDVTIGGQKVRALRHSMGGLPGFEIYGPWDVQQAVRDALDQTGAKHGLVKVGMKGGPVVTIEGGWLPNPLPAIYAGEYMKPFRQWLTPFHFESFASLGGSYESKNIVDHYVDPIEAGYGAFIDFNRDFVGRDALAERARSQTRKKVTLLWNTDDVLAVMCSVFKGENPGRFPNVPQATFATFVSDKVTKGGQMVGTSRHQYGYSANVKSFISLAIVDIASSTPGTEVKLLWGEAYPGNPTIAKHQMYEIRATVAQAPYFEVFNKTKG